MFFLISGLCLVTMQLTLINGSNTILKKEYKPYGPAMCRELCLHSNDSFIFNEEGLACHRISADFSNRTKVGSFEDVLTCIENKNRMNVSTSLAVIRGWDICSKDEETFTLIAKLTAEVVPIENTDIFQNSPDKVLHRACREGKLCVVKYILFKGLADINCRGKFGRTPVMVAAKYEQMEIFYFLVSNGSDMSIVDDDKNTVLHIACISGNTNIVKKLVEGCDSDIEARNSHLKTPLMLAVYSGRTELFDFLLKKGCNPRAVDDERYNILHEACKDGHVNMVKDIILKNLTDIESRCKHGMTPMMVASRSGHKEVVELLVNQGGNLTAVNDVGFSVIHMACFGGNVETVKYILTQDGAGIDRGGDKGRTPLMIAAAMGHKEVVDLLVNSGCNMSVADDKGNTALHVVCLRSNVEMVEHILSKETLSIEKRGVRGQTPVMLAARAGKRRVYDILVKRGCRLTSKDRQGNNILHVACSGGHVNMVKHIVSQNMVDIDSRGYHGRTPVLIASRTGNKGVFDFLVSEGCDLTEKDSYGNNILHTACFGGHVNMVKHIVSQNMVDIDSREYHGRTPVFIASRTDHKGVFDFLVSESCDLTIKDSQGNNILHIACFYGHDNMVKHIVSQNMVDIDSRESHGRTPVFIASRTGNKGVFDFLVSEGCDLTIKDSHGNNILHIACFYGHIKMVKHIVSQNMVDIDSREYNGRTPVLIAATVGHKGVFDFLVSKGCDLTEKDNQGNNILHVACIGGHVNMVKYILKLRLVKIRAKNKYGRTAISEAKHLGHEDIVALLIAWMQNEKN